MLLLLSHFSCVRLCVTPQMAAHQAPSSLGFSRQEHWSGLASSVLAREGAGCGSTPVLLPGESQGWGILVVCHLWGHTESDMTDTT